jgi:1-acyl-sn-glycerol-3-phosphate acyltransferase
MSQVDSTTETHERENPLLAAVLGVAADARSIANRYLFRGMMGTSAVAAIVLQRLLPERHPVLPDHDTIWGLVKLQAYALARVCGVTVTVRGRQRLGGDEPVVFVANHQSYFDIVALLAFLPGRNRFVVTQELADHPLWGPIFRAVGMVVMEDGGEDCLTPEAVMDGLQRITDADASIVIFPEGHRSPTARLLPFGALPFRAMIELGVPVVPVAIRGSRSVMPPARADAILPGGVEIVVEEPIPTAHLVPDDYHPLREDVRMVIARHVEEIGPLLEPGTIDATCSDDDLEAGAAGMAAVAEPGRA